MYIYHSACWRLRRLRLRRRWWWWLCHTHDELSRFPVKLIFCSVFFFTPRLSNIIWIEADVVLGKGFSIFAINICVCEPFWKKHKTWSIWLRETVDVLLWSETNLFFVFFFFCFFYLVPTIGFRCFSRFLVDLSICRYLKNYVDEEFALRWFV